jgi:hypothetical protein
MISRRSLLAGTSAATASFVLASCQRDGGAVVDVTRFGAKGDGTTDDSQAILAAVAALRSRGTLYFPRGTYRFAHRWPVGGAAIVITGVSDVAVEFDPGARLLMDNLDPAAQTGTSHGLLVRGPAWRIALRNVDIQWSTTAKRSLGDGIRVEGSPGSSAATPTRWPRPRAVVDGIALSDCVIQGSPQAGVIMMGVSGITVTGLRVADTGADGLHFNACQRASIDDYRGVDTGDDGLALVTYFASHFSFDATAHTFSFPALTDWSNADFLIRNVEINGGKANGVRIAGAHRVTIEGLRVIGVRSGAALMVDSAEPGTDVGWDYVTSRAVHVEDLTATTCDTGIHLLARPNASGDQRFTDFDVRIIEATLVDCMNWSVRVESLTDRRVSGFRIDNCSSTATSTTGGNGGVSVANSQGIALGTVSIRHAEPVVAFTAVNAGQFAIDHLSVTIQSQQSADTAKPCVWLDHSDGVIDDLELVWSAAPSSWNAVRLSAAGQCRNSVGDAPFLIKSLKLIPPTGKSTITCS